MGFLRPDLNIFEPTVASFMRGPARILAMEEDMRELVEVLDDIIVLSEEPWMYELRPGVTEVGTCSGNVELVHEAEEFDIDQIFGEIREVKYGPETIKTPLLDADQGKIITIFEKLDVLVALTMKPDQLIRAHVFCGVRLHTIEMEHNYQKDFYPRLIVKWSFRAAYIIDQRQVPKSELEML